MLEPEISVEADHERLQAEWMRFRQHVVDAATGLPTLAAVLDDVRRLTEERGTTGLLYIDLALRAETPTPDPVKLMARALLALKAEGGLGPRDIVAPLSVGGDKFLVFLRGSEAALTDGPAGETRLRRLRDQLQAALR
ncbi:MAG TPA: hypothetical protein VIZ31_09245, partial [Vicinamibacteria bacterium]